MEPMSLVRSKLGTAASALLPPVIWRALWGSGRIRYVGRFASWEEAASAARGIEDPEILQRVWRATREVIEGRAGYERDGQPFERLEHRWPVIAVLMWAASCRGGRLRVLDFGGSLGSVFFQMRPWLASLPQVEWNVVEQPHYVRLARQEIQVTGLRFYASIAECRAEREFEVALLSSVLQYVHDPWAVLRALADAGASEIVIDRTLFVRGSQERICVQKVPPKLGGGSYPCRMLCMERIVSCLSDTHELIAEFDDDLDRAPLGAWFRGLVFTLKRNAEK